MNNIMFTYAFSILSLISLSSNAMHNGEIAVVHPQATFIPQKHGAMLLWHDGSDFSLYTHDKVIPIQRAFVDKDLRGVSTDTLSKMIAADCYLKVKQLDNEDFGLELKQRLRGGGIAGANAGFWIGKGLTYFVVGAPIAILSIFCPIAGGLLGPVVGGFAAASGLETASNVVGLGCGVIGGVATGPI